ncbi:MAG TPA: diguanylate cyclase [Solirubrobacteraceae bacterium]
MRAQAVVLGPLALAAAAMASTRVGAPAGTCLDIAWTSAAWSALVSLWFARSRAQPAHRRRWTLWAAAAGAWLVGQLAWDLYGVIGFPQSPNLADVSWWGFAVLTMVSVVGIGHEPRAKLAVTAVETGPLVASAVVLTTAQLWGTATGSTLALAPKLSALAYPALYVAATVLMLDALVGGGLRSVRAPGVRLVLSGIAAQALAFTLWCDKLLTRTYVPGHTWLDRLWVVGLGVIAVGGLLAARRPEEVTAPEEPNYRSAILPAGMLVVVLLALVQARVTHAPILVKILLEAGLALCSIALVARSALLGQRLRAMLIRERAALARLAEREAELERLNRQLTDDSRRDPLTGVMNRRALAGDLPALDELQRAGTERLAFALCDADCFKAYNDRFGHLAGDQALRMIAATIRGALREGDAAYRYGGEEMLLVLRSVGRREAMKIAERVRAAVERAGFRHPDAEPGMLTVSIGVAAGPDETGDLLARADAALYEAKRLGRNRVIGATDQVTVLPTVGRARIGDSDEPVPRQLRSMLAVSRAAAAGGGPMPVLEALAETICRELSFQVVAVNLLDEQRRRLDVVIVKGDQEAREALLGTSSPWAEWQALVDSTEEPSGAIWLPAGTYEWQVESAVWTPPSVPPPAPDGWHPEDMLLLPLRGTSGDVLGVISVDQPVLGRRPTEEELNILMAVADHAGLALEQAQRDAQLATQGPPEARLAVMLLLAEALDMRDPSTAQHSHTVGRYAREIALALGLAADRVERIHAAGVVHDLGKLGIADEILRKEGPLTEDEWRQMRRHPAIGAQILEHAGMADIALWVGAHHERVDGDGYPAGLSGPKIPLEARILAVADAYEAMIADRPYRAGISDPDARAELQRCAGSQFDPEVVEAFLRTATPALPSADAPLPPDALDEAVAAA